jgi:RNA polymerase sigma-70 factor (ECF subfamily)
MEQALTTRAVISEPKPVDATDADFVALVNRQSRFVFRVAYAVLRNVHDAEDVVQETFLKLYRARAWRGMREENGFLARSAWRIAVGRLKHRREAAPEMETASASRDPEAIAISADWNAAVHRLIDALPEELRQPLALSAIQELDSRTVAAILGIPEGTVRTRVLRARTMLKQKLERLKEGRR